MDPRVLVCARRGRGHILQEKNGAVLLQNAALAGFGQKRPRDFIRATRKERRCFAAECGPDPFGHTRALEGPF